MSSAISLTKNEINKIIRKIDLMQDKECKKAAFVITHVGLRVTETALLEVRDVMLPSGTLRDEVFLRGDVCKGLKPRTVWFTNDTLKEAIQALVDYRKKRGWGTSLNSEYQGLIPESRLLYNNRGRGFAIADKKMKLADGSIKYYKGCHSLQQMLQNVYKRCGHKDASSHTGRRSYATNAANRGVDLRFIQMALGHEDPEMTLEYIDVNQRIVKQCYEAAW